MWEQTLKKIDHLTTPHRICELWGGDSSTLKIINNQINCVYYFRRNQMGCYLRITHPTIRSYEELKASIDYQNHLFSCGVPVCKPILSNLGNYIEQVTQGNLIFMATVMGVVQIN